MRKEGDTVNKISAPPGKLAVALGVAAAVIIMVSSHMSFASAANSTAAGIGSVKGTPKVGAKGVTETVRQIMSRPTEPAAGGPREAPPVRRPGGPKSSPSGATRASSRPVIRSGVAVRTPQTVATNFLGAQLSDSNVVPPDSMGAAGPTQFLVGVNGRLRTFDKGAGSPDGVLDTTPDSFFTSVSNGLATSDPRVRYDRLSGRWIMTMITFDPKKPSTVNRIVLALSSGSVITSSSSFTFFFIPQDTLSGDTGCIIDFDTLAVDANALYIGGNEFCGTQLTYVHSNAFVVRKSSVLGGGPIVVTAFPNLTGGVTAGPVSPEGADNEDPAAVSGYLIGVDVVRFSQLDMRRVIDPGGSPTISGNLTIAVDFTTNPISVPSLGSSANLDAVDDRLSAAVVRNGQLWTTHNIEVDSSGIGTVGGGRDGSRWYAIQNLGTTPAVAQSGTVFDPSASNPLSYWMPSIATSAQGHTAIGGSVAGVNHFADAWTAGRLSTDGANTMGTPTVYTASGSAYNINPPRWGDYSYTSSDPDDGMTMWTIQEYANATNSWGVRVAKLQAPPPATPASASPSSVAKGLSSVDVAITGTQASGTGFFDPGPGYAKRIGASVGGGVIVNSVTYNNPTQVVLNLNTTGAAVGAQNVTVTNPDGQSAAGNGILTVAPVSCPSGWSCADIGGPTPAGSQGLNNGSWTVQGGGVDIWGTSDQFHFVSQSLPGDGTLSARVVSQSNTDQWAKAGVMLRQSSDPNSAYYAVEMTPSNGILVQYRSSAGASALGPTGVSGTPPAYIRVSRSGSTFSAYTSSDGVNWTLVPGSTVTMSVSGGMLAGLAVTSHNTSALSMAVFDSVSLALCPGGWSCADIGGPTLGGSQSLSNGTWTVQGGGVDIWGTSDQFHFVSQSLPGDGTLSARVVSQSNTDQWAKAGVMLRQSSDPNSAYYAVEMTPSNGILVQYRSSAGASALGPTGVSGTPPAYIRVTRSGSTFSAYTSSDGVNWTLVPGSTVTMSVSGGMLAGLAVTSHNTSALSMAVFDSVSLASCPSGWSCADIGGPTLGGSQSLSNGTWTVQGGGVDIWGTSDQFHFVSQSLPGDGTLSARVVSQSNTDQWAKAGVMLRQSSDPNSAYYAVEMTPSNGILVQYRSSAGASALGPTGVSGTPPAYIRVSRSGSTFSAYTSSDGMNWTLVGGSTVTMSVSGGMLAGLAVTSHNPSALGTAAFDGVSIA
jgi:hypothetical protein